MPCKNRCRSIFLQGGPAAPLRNHLPKWRNWQTRMVQVHVPARVWGFESLLRHHYFWNLALSLVVITKLTRLTSLFMVLSSTRAMCELQRSDFSSVSTSTAPGGAAL